MDADFVLMYHSVEPYTSDPYQVTVHPDRFARQLRWLRRRGLRGVSMRELLAARRDGTARGLVGLTFDDGYADFVHHVMPVLAEYGFTATVFVVAGSLGGTNEWDVPGPRKRLMTAGEVRHAATAGVEIGSHSLNHRRLPDADAPTLADEVRRSRTVLSGLTGQDVTGFCYPYGAVGTREAEAVRAAGYGYACAVGPTAITGAVGATAITGAVGATAITGAVGATADAGRYALPRTFVGDRDTAPRLWAKWARHGLRRGSGGVR